MVDHRPGILLAGKMNIIGRLIVQTGNIIRRTEAFDQPRFQKQCLDFGTYLNNFHGIDQTYQTGSLWAEALKRLKIRADAVFEIFGFTDV